MLTDRSRKARPFSRRALCSSLAIATALIVGSSAAHAQSFQGTGTFQPGGSGTITTGTNTTTIDITSPNAVIDWAVFPGIDTVNNGVPINFQPSGTTATFQSASDFSVLNRILPTDPSRPIQFNGTVVSQIQGASTTTGGTVYFYSPGGLIIGSTAVFNVGNLGLTSIDPAVVGGAFEQTGPSGDFVQFTGTVRPGSAVTIQSGAQITGTTPGTGSYLAIVAPQITQQGSISGKRVAALVSADAATITFNLNGLFDIQVSSGTSANGTTLFNSGSITGPAGDPGNASRIYMVAVPKNQAITMAIAGGSTLGFDVADAADVVGNAIVLSGGHDVFGGAVSSAPSGGAGSGTAAIQVNNASFTSTTTGRATGQVDIFAGSGGSTSFASNLTLQSDGNIQAFADSSGSSLSVGGNLAFDVSRFSSAPGGSTVAGMATLGVSNGASASVTGTATINANAFGGSSSTSGVNGGNATGGNAQIGTFQGGTITIGGALTVTANGNGGQAVVAGSTGGTGTGGLSQIYHDQAGTITLNNGALLNANGTGGAGNGGGAAGAGQGGTARANLYNSTTGNTSGSIAVTGNLNVQAVGFGGAGAGVAGGAGTGGNVFVGAGTVGGTQLSVSGNLSANAIGRGGNGSSGGFGTGGTATAGAFDGDTLQIGGNLDVFGMGFGGNGAGGAAGSSQGGTSVINALQGGNLTVGGNAQSLALGFNGSGNGSVTTAIGGTAQVVSSQSSSLNVTGSLFAASGGIGSGDPTTGSIGQGAGAGGSTLVSASTGGAIQVGTVLRARSVGIGTSNRNGAGGTVNVQAFTGGTISTNEFNILATGLGGDDVGSGAGSGTGGIGRLTVNGAGSAISVANGNSTGVAANGDLDFIDVNGFGGDTHGGGSGIGGNATGGTAEIFVQNGGTLNGPPNPGLAVSNLVWARAFAGNADTNGTTGGQAQGGTVNIVVDNGTMTIDQILPSSFAQGGGVIGTPTGVVNGGNALGGVRNITIQNGGVLTTTSGGGGPGAQGGNASATGRGGDASGGSANLFMDNGTFNVTDRFSVFVQNAGGSGIIGGNATTGGATATIQNGSSLNVANTGAVQAFSVFTSATGGSSTAPGGTTGGNGTAGSAQLFVTNSTINAANLTVASNGIGGGGFTAQAGNGTGGTARVQLRGATLSGINFSLNADGEGGSVDPTQAGNGGGGFGGFATLESQLGTNTLNFTQIGVLAQGLGGDAGLTGNGGVGIGGGGQFLANAGSTMTVNAADSFVETDGEGGDAVGGTGGQGLNGFARVVVNAGSTATFNGNVGLSGEAEGGDGAVGGDVLAAPASAGPRAALLVNGGALTVTGSTRVSAKSDGGTGTTGNGGAGNGGYALVVAGNTTTPSGTINLASLEINSSGSGGASTSGDGGSASAGRAHLFTGGGNITVGGTLDIIGDAFGGSGINGGDALNTIPDRQPRALVAATDGTITVNGSANLSADATGGAGSNGGRGGIGFAGEAAVDSQSGVSPASITFQNITVTSNGLGGAGGAGLPNQAGGAGGDGYGGLSELYGNAGLGVLTVNGSTTLISSGTGENGGQGGASTSGAGGTGGAGGRGFGGYIVAGTKSGNDTPQNSGSASFGDIFGVASGFGGTGGAGGAGTTQGNGGAGGLGFGGRGGLLVRGSPVTVGDVDIFVHGAGGAGGAGATAGVGGDGIAGDGFLTVTQRFNRTERGTLTGGAVTIQSIGAGGTGSVAGTSYYAPAAGAESEFFVRQADVNLASFSLTTTGTAAPNLALSALTVTDPNIGTPVVQSFTITPEPYDLTMQAATATIGSFTMSTPGDMRVVLDSSTLNVGDLSLTAGNFVVPATAPATIGTINVSNSLFLQSGLDFRAFANFNVAGSGTFDADGSVQTGNLTFDGPLDISAVGSVTTGNLSATDVTLRAGGNVTTAAINADGTIDLTAGGAIATGALTAGDSVFANALGTVNVGNVSAGIVNPLASPPDGYTIGLRSGTALTTGNLQAAGNIGLSSPGSITAGSITAGQIVLALPGTSFSSGAITTTSTTGGRVYIANNSMESLGGTIGDTFNPGPILAANQVATAGPIAINGNVATGTVQANSSQALSIAGATTARVVAVLLGGTSVAAGNLTAGDQVIVASGGQVALGNIDVGIAIQNGSLRKLSVGSTNGPVALGNVNVLGDLGIQTGGTITASSLRGRDVLLLAGGGVGTGPISALNGTQPNGRIFIGNFSMANTNANVFQQFGTAGVQALFAGDPVRTGGAITIAGAVQGGFLKAATAQGISLQNVTAGSITQPGSVEIDAGGLATVAGRIAADNVEITSGDIDIASTGSIDGLSANGEVSLASINTAGALIGDGVSGGGYALSNAEFGRLKGGNIRVVAQDFSANATDMTIGTLSIDAGQLYGANGFVLFATGNLATETPSGTIRIAGAVNGTNFAATNEVDFYADLVELETTAGSLKLSGTSGGLGGLVYVEADRFHVASDAILAKLRADPHYAGNVAELNAPATVQRPDGVLNALGLDLEVSDAILIQNTGTVAMPAGFVTTIDGAEVGGDTTPPTGGRELVLNGQFVTSSGTLAGRQAYEAAITQAKADAMADGETFGAEIAEGGTLNGCGIISGVCSIATSTPVAPPASEITVVTSAGLDDSPVAPTASDADEGDSDEGSNEQKDEDSATDEGSSPIAPPVPLISTRALDGIVDVVEPVSGAGNPALFGSVVEQAPTQGEKP